MHAPTGGSEGLEDRTSHVLALLRQGLWSPRPPTASPGARLPPRWAPLHLPERMGTESGPQEQSSWGCPTSAPAPPVSPVAPAHGGDVPRLQLESVALTGKNPCCEHSQPANIPALRQPRESRREEGALCPGRATLHPIRDLQPLRQAHSSQVPWAGHCVTPCDPESASHQRSVPPWAGCPSGPPPRAPSQAPTPGCLVLFRLHSCEGR